MILGQSAATAAVLAIDANKSVQDVPYAQLRERLLADGQVLEHKGSATGGKTGLDPQKLPGVVVDDSQAKTTGNWQSSRAAARWIGDSYRHDGNASDGKATARFEATLPAAGKYEVRLAYTPNANRSTKVTAIVQHAAGERTLVVNQRKTPDIDGLFISLGVFDFADGKPAIVSLSNQDADGYVIIDAVQWVPVAKK